MKSNFWCYQNLTGLIAFLVLFVSPSLALSQSTLSFRIYSGISLPAAIGMDLSLRGNQYQISRVGFESRSLQFPLYYGGSVGINTRIKNLRLRVGVEFLHDKMYARSGRRVRINSSDDPNLPPGESLPFSAFFDSFSISHGLNYLLLTASIPILENPVGIHRLKLFSGLGTGVIIPHVESQRGEQRRGQYELHAPALMLHLEMEYRFTGGGFLFLEGKWGISRIRNARVVEGTVSLTPRAWHLVAGIGWGGGKK